ncbi:hypothetical protein [Tsukamurella strandjordii]|uniref:Uncharacterized protein n=1 Tax=Tsukamurella strandjordii TaxID=147577 RepID=A0AA90NLJ4_9ACTN|nr:hypothetical protein [Tsukamurella strandjordii]MDP0396694.1 hypothetical protein [Tsukamurella strandjordii]
MFELAGATVLTIAIIFATVNTRPALSGRYPEVVQMYSDLLKWRVRGLFAGLAAAIAVPVVGWTVFDMDGMTPAAVGAPTAFATVFLACMLAGERTAYAPVADTRTADLTPRRTQRYVGTTTAVVTTFCVVCATAVAIALLTFTNRRGMFVFTCDGQPPGDDKNYEYGAVTFLASTTNTAGARLALICIAVVTIAAALVALAATGRARPDTDLVASSEDDALRRNTVRVAAGILVSCSALIGAICTYAIATILDTPVPACAAPSWWSTAGTALWWSELAWFALFVWGLVSIVAPPKATRTSASIG